MLRGGRFTLPLARRKSQKYVNIAVPWRIWDWHVEHGFKKMAKMVEMNMEI